MDVYYCLDDDPNTIDHEISPTVTVRKFKNYNKKD